MSKPFKLEVIEKRRGRQTVLNVQRAGDCPAPPLLRGRRVIPQRDYSAACYDGDGHKTCIMPSCQCPCHQAKVIK